MKKSTVKKNTINTNDPDLLETAEFVLEELKAKMEQNGGKCHMCDQAYAPGIPHDVDCGMDMLEYALKKHKQG